MRLLVVIDSMLLIVLFISVCTAIPMVVYDNARFEPSDFRFSLINSSNVASRDVCACQCFTDPMCRIATFSGSKQQCSLFFARLWQGVLRLVVTSENTSVLNFDNKTLPTPPLITSTNETVYGIWNTTAGGNSAAATEGVGVGHYFYNETVMNALDQNISTKYTNFGACAQSASQIGCGQNTGLYLTPRRGPSLLVALRFCTPLNPVTRDPLTVIIEGSNLSSSALTNGSSWTLIYNGSTGLDPDPGRHKFGPIQTFWNNSIWYSSYRLLVTSKRGIDDATHYAEVDFLGY